MRKKVINMKEAIYTEEISGMGKFNYILECVDGQLKLSVYKGNNMIECHTCRPDKNFYEAFVNSKREAYMIACYGKKDFQEVMNNE